MAAHKTIEGSWLFSIEKEPEKECRVYVRFFPASNAGNEIRHIKVLLKDPEWIRRTGQDTTSRMWIEAFLLPSTIRYISEKVEGVFSIHPPLYTEIGDTNPTGGSSR